MASYAYNPSSSINSSFNMRPFSDAMAGNPLFTTGWYNDNPNLGWEELLRTTNPSMNVSDILRRMFPMIRDRWTNQQWNEQVAGKPMTSFTDYVKNYDFNREFAKTSPNMRRENPSYFNRPVRTIPF